MVDRHTIIKTLYSDIHSFVQNDGFTKKVYDVRLGIFDPAEMHALPSLGLWVMGDEVQDDLMDNSIYRSLNFIIYGYVNAEKTDSFDDFYTLIAEIEQFLYSTNSTYYKNTVLGNLDITYGGTNRQIGLFVLNFSILYSQSGLES